MGRPPIHAQRTAIVLIATLGWLACFFPAGVVPAIGSMTHVALARTIAAGLLAVVWMVAAVGKWRAPMSVPLRVVGFAAAGLIVAVSLGRMAVLGTGAIRRFDDGDPRAGVYYGKACDAGQMGACTRLGGCYWDGSCGLEKDQQRSVGLWQRGCDGGDMDACGQLGICYEIGGCGLPKSGQRAAALYGRACDGGDLGMCNNLGICFHKGQCGFAKDEARAEKLYDKACRGGDVGGCHNLELIRN